MSSAKTELAPFARGDRVIYRPRPEGVETVELVEYRHEGWGGWYIRTRRQVGPTESFARRYDRAELFDPAPAARAPITIGGPVRRLLRRLRFHRWVRISDIPAAERAHAVAGWAPAGAVANDRGELPTDQARGLKAHGLDRAHVKERAQ